MPGFILHQQAGVQCVHFGVAEPVAASPRVKVSGQAVVTLANPYRVSACTFPAMSTGALPCVTAQFTSAATKVTSMGQPVLLQDSQSTCVPNPTPLVIGDIQTRVSAK